MDKELPNLSKAEYNVLHILWKKSPLSVSETHKLVEPKHGWALTTTRTVMDRMANKNLLSKKNFHGIFLYAPLISRPAGLAKFVQFFADQIFETDANSVVSMFSNSGGLSDEEIRELRQLLDDSE